MSQKCVVGIKGVLVESWDAPRLDKIALCWIVLSDFHLELEGCLLLPVGKGLTLLDCLHFLGQVFQISDPIFLRFSAIC